MLEFDAESSRKNVSGRWVSAVSFSIIGEDDDDDDDDRTMRRLLDLDWDLKGRVVVMGFMERGFDGEGSVGEGEEGEEREERIAVAIVKQKERRVVLGVKCEMF